MRERIPTQSKELRIVNQPYLPQNAVVVNVGTIVNWFNADVKHPHRISLVDNNTKNAIYDSGIIKSYTASRPIKFNNTGTFTYSGPSFDKAVPSYKMNGTIIVVNQPLSTSFNTNATNTTTPTTASATSLSLSSSAARTSTTNTIKNVDTITTLMVPANLLNKAISEIKDQGLGIDNQYPFKFEWYINQGFNSVEINASYFRIPTEAWINTWLSAVMDGGCE